jgi:precorrin-3B synthase
MTGPGFLVQGWCPGALRPMLSGDGLVVRVRPMGGRLTRAQAAGIARAAAAHGNGLIDLSARGNVQLRGVTEASHPALIDDLRALDLIDADAAAEARRNLMVTPFADAATDALAASLGTALREGPDLPGKFGFAVDTGPAPVLHDSAADIRLERDARGGLILRCDGLGLGAPVTPDTAAGQAVALARWFVEAGGVAEGRGRMAALIARGARPPGALAPAVAPAPAAPAPGPGQRPEGALVAFEFGQMAADTLAALAALGDLRVTPWRMLLVEGLRQMPGLPGLILDPDAPIRRVTACTGAPGCLQAHAPVRPLARRLAPQVPPGRHLHVSGCAKGCAHPGVADVTLVATPQGFDRIHAGTAQDAPAARALAGAAIDLKGLF